LPTSCCTAAHFGLLLKLTTAPSHRPACLLPRTSCQATVRRPAQQRREIYATMNTLPIKIRPQPSYCPSLYCIPPPYCSPCFLQLLQIDKRYGLAPCFCPDSGGYSSSPEPSAILSATPPAGGVPDCFVVIRVVRGYASRCARLLRPRWPLLTQLHLAMGMSPAPRAGFNRSEADCGRDESARPPQADELRGNRPPTRVATTSYRVRSTQIPRYPETTAQNYPPPLLLAHELLFNYQEKSNNRPVWVEWRLGLFWGDTGQGQQSSSFLRREMA